MKKQLSAGTTVVVDRYSYSGVAFSAAKVHGSQSCQCTLSVEPLSALASHLVLTPGMICICHTGDRGDG